MFDPANIVRKFSWKKMTESGKDDEGWSWKELDSANGRPTYERDGLKLLAAFMKHSDNKPPQQRLTCHKVDVDTKDYSANDYLRRVRDAGAGRRGDVRGRRLFTSNDGAKMNLDNWSKTSLWNKVGTDGSPKPCQATLHNSLTAKDGLKDPAISEEGRRLDAGLMCQLTDQQISDLFTVARASEMPEYHNKDGSFKTGVTDASVVQKWVAAFKQKREDLARVGASGANSRPT